MTKQTFGVPLAWDKSTCIDPNTGCQIKQLCTQGTWFYVLNSECTGFRIHRLILNVSDCKIPSDQNICSDLREFRNIQDSDYTDYTVFVCFVYCGVTSHSAIV